MSIEIRERGTINAWPVVYVVGTEEPLIEDEELGRRLGMARPRQVRDLIDRMESAGALGEVCRTVRQTSKTGGRPSVVRLLTERQALKVVMRSETPTADTIQDEVIDVYMAWRRGRVAQPGPGLTAADVARIVVATLDAREKPKAAPALDLKLDREARRKLWNVIQITAKGVDVHPNKIAMDVCRSFEPALTSYRDLRFSQLPKVYEDLKGRQQKGLVTDTRTESERLGYEIVTGKRRLKMADPQSIN